MIVLDVSASISPDTFSRIGETLRKLVATRGRYGLVVFSNVAYEALPPGTPASALRPLIRYFDGSEQQAPGALPRSADEPVDALVQQRNADLGRPRPRAPDPGRRPPLAVAGRPDQRPRRRSAGHPTAQPGRCRRTTVAGGHRLRVVALNAAPDDEAFFARVAGCGDRPRLDGAGERRRPRAATPASSASRPLLSSRSPRRCSRSPSTASGRRGCAGERRGRPREGRAHRRGDRARRGGGDPRLPGGRRAVAGEDAIQNGDREFVQQPGRRDVERGHRAALRPLRRGLLDLDVPLRFRGAEQRFAALSAEGRGYDNGVSASTVARRARGRARRARAEPRTARSPRRPTTCSASSPSPTRDRPGRSPPAPIDQSVADFQAAVRLDPTNADAKFNLELLLRQLVAQGRSAGTELRQRRPVEEARRGAGGGLPGRGY